MKKTDSFLLTTEQTGENMKYLIYISMAITAMTLMVACERKGPAERAGERVDEGVEEVREEAQQGKEDIEDRQGN
jgi:hypothetical protein